MIKVRAHTCYLGTTGYAAHARNFFRNLSQYVDLRVRNYTWDDDPHYINSTDTAIVDTMTLYNKDGVEEDFPTKIGVPNYDWVEQDDFQQEVDIVLVDTDHCYFYQEYSSNVKIAYTVWESTELPERFFNQLLKFDYLWVVSEWHKRVAVKQGYPANRVYVVNEGVSGEFVPTEKNNDKFQYMFFGRWDYRKAVPEIINAFLEAFPDNDNVELILSADNLYAVDGMHTTEERLDHYGFTDERIKVKHFLSNEDYKQYIQEGNVLITCARSEGWNIPLIEAMAAGTPAIYSGWGAQMEFTKGEGCPVRVLEERPASIGADLGYAGNTPGLYGEPDYEHLKHVILDCYNNYQDKLNEAIHISNRIHRDYNWDKIALDGKNILQILVGWKKGKIPNELAVVLSHADTTEKVSLLKSNVLHLKNQGYDILISSHIKVPEEIFDLADVVIVDKDNPIVYTEDFAKYSTTTPIFWIRHHEYDLSYAFDFNHGLAAMRLCKNGLAYADQNNYEIVHFVNYDYIIKDHEVLRSHSASIKAGIDLVSYGWDSIDYESLNTALFSVKTSRLREPFLSVYTLEEYFRWSEVTILEDVLVMLCKDFNISTEVRNISTISQNNIINGVIIPTYPQIETYSGERFQIFLAKQHNEYYIAFTGAVKEILNMEVSYGSETTFFQANYEMKFVYLPQEILQAGVTVRVPKYGITYKYDLNSKVAQLHIKNHNRVINLSQGNQSAENIEMVKENITIHFIDGPFVEITGSGADKYLVKFIDADKDETVFEEVVGINSWVRCSRKYFTNWKIVVLNLTTRKEHVHNLDLTEKRVLINLDSTALGDTLAWFPHVEEFQNKHNCKVIICTFKNSLYQKQYPNLEFIEPGQVVHNLYASYQLGWFFEGDEWNPQMHPLDFRKQPMQKTTTDILGLEYSNLPPRLGIPDLKRPIKKPYVCIAMHSTAQPKYWNNPTGWQEVTNYFKDKGYEVVMLSLEEDGYMGNFYPDGVVKPVGARTLENAMNYLQHCEMFVGISSGLSWLSWAVGKPTAIISGWSWPCTEVLGPNIIRVFKGGVCTGCFNRKRLDAGDWNWCPDQKGTHRQFECTRVISGSDVIMQIEDYWNKGYAVPSVEQVVQESYELGMVQNHKEIINAAKFFKDLDVKNFMEIGTDQGGTFAIWSKLSQDGIRISVDLPHGPFGRTDYNETKRDEYLSSLGSNVTMIWGSSHDATIKQKVFDILGETQLDFLFIDGDHTYSGVRQDYLMYKEFVKPGGWIGFHDIKDTEFHRNANCRVDNLWNELEGNKVEFLDNRSSYGGIGFIQVPLE